MKIIFFALLVSFFLVGASAENKIPENLFNQRLSDSDRKKLEDGEILFESIGKIRNIKINETDETSQAINVMKSLKPNHLSEIIQIRPYKGNENLVQKISEILGNVENYIGIPYFSERAQKWYDLYSEAEILNIENGGNAEIIAARFYMKPFGYYTSETRIEKRENYYFFTMKNTQKLRYYDKFDAVGKENMQAAIAVFRSGESWVIYALGGAKIIDLPFLVKRAETSFTNRIKSFAEAIFQKLQENQSSGS